MWNLLKDTKIRILNNSFEILCDFETAYSLFS